MANNPIVNTGTVTDGVVVPSSPNVDIHNCDVVNKFVTEAGNGSTITSTEYSNGYIQTVIGNNDVASILECTRLEEKNLGNTPEYIDKVQYLNGKQSQKELSLLDEMPDQKVYGDVEHEPTSFTLDETDLTLPVGGQHRFIITPTDTFQNIPVLVWIAGVDEKGYACCHVNDNILYADRVSEGVVTMKAIDITNPNDAVNPTTKVVTVNVTVVDTLKPTTGETTTSETPTTPGE